MCFWDNRETLLRIAQSWGAFPITNLQKAGSFLEQLHNGTNGSVNIDFLDTGNWDCFESFSTIPDRGLLQINWHDFIEQDEQQPRTECRASDMLFPASLYSVAMRFNRIERVGNEEIVCFALRGYSLTNNEVRKLFPSGADKIDFYEDRPFYCEIIRTVNGHVECIDCITSAMYTALIVPKYPPISEHFSKAFLYRLNLAEIDGAFERCGKDIDKSDESDKETICQKSNTIRTNMEALMKLECCFRDINTPKPYSQVLLGDLWRLLKTYHKTIDCQMSRFLKLANNLSHDTGILVEKKDGQEIASTARMYAGYFR
ncbi:MAG: hypothetical protein V1918_00820, partial [Planctomycetota bacterium]